LSVLSAYLSLRLRRMVYHEDDFGGFLLFIAITFVFVPY
jgi:hypothetical protein